MTRPDWSAMDETAEWGASNVVHLRRAHPAHELQAHVTPEPRRAGRTAWVRAGVAFVIFAALVAACYWSN